MEGLLKDWTHSLKMFRQSPAFTFAAVMALALGIGGNTAVFSVVDTVLLKPARFADPERTVFLITTTPTGPDYGSSDPKFNLWRQQTSVLQDVTGQAYSRVNLTGVDVPEQIQTARVTSAYFRLVGLQIVRGRSFSSEEDLPTGRHVVVISDGFWKRHFVGDPGILGKTVSLGGSPFEVIGITAPDAVTEAQEAPDVWTPLQIDPVSNSQVQYFVTLGRLKPGITLPMAQAQLRIAAEEYRRRFPDSITMSAGFGFGVDPVQEVLVRGIRPSLMILLAAVGLVLLIACANVANLLLVHATNRTREMAIRAAIGARRSHIFRQLLTESVMLSMTGGLLGSLFGIVGIRGLLALNPSIPRIGKAGYLVGIDWHVLVFTFVISLATGIVFGIIPALHGSQIDLAACLRSGTRSSGAALRQGKIRSVLVIGEIALTLILLIGAALLIRSFVALRSVNPGFDSHNILTLHMSLTSPRFDSTYQVNQFVQDSAQRLRNLPGVVAVGAASWLPFETGATLPFVVVGRPLTGPSHGFGHWRNISPGYFDSLRIPVLRGRLFSDRDNGKAGGVAIINEAMARQYWPNLDPLNDRIVIAPNIGPEFDEPARQIVGIVGDIREDSLDQNPRPTMYVPIAQVTDARNPRVRQSLVWLVRTTVEPASLARAIEHELSDTSGGLPVAGTRLMDELMAGSTARQEFNMQLLGSFGSVALLLAALGIYGLVAYSVQQRVHEIGIRLALGASPNGVRRAFLAEGMRLAGIGIALGLVGALGLTRFMRSFLFGIQANDPAVFVVVPVVLISVALLAIWLPARRACRIDPIEALRCD